jgi:hypothetical protein
MAELFLSRAEHSLSLLTSGGLASLREGTRERTRDVRAGRVERLTSHRVDGGGTTLLEAVQRGHVRVVRRRRRGGLREMGRLRERSVDRLGRGELHGRGGVGCSCGGHDLGLAAEEARERGGLDGLWGTRGREILDGLAEDVGLRAGGLGVGAGVGGSRDVREAVEGGHLGLHRGVEDRVVDARRCFGGVGRRSKGGGGGVVARNGTEPGGGVTSRERCVVPSGSGTEGVILRGLVVVKRAKGGLVGGSSCAIVSGTVLQRVEDSGGRLVSRESGSGAILDRAVLKRVETGSRRVGGHWLVSRRLTIESTDGAGCPLVGGRCGLERRQLGHDWDVLLCSNQERRGW